MSAVPAWLRQDKEKRPAPSQSGIVDEEGRKRIAESIATSCGWLSAAHMKTAVARIFAALVLFLAASVQAATPAGPLSFSGTVPTGRAVGGSCTTVSSSYPAGRMLTVRVRWTGPVSGSDSVQATVGTPFHFSKNVPPGTYTVYALACSASVCGCEKQVATVIDTLAVVAMVPGIPELAADSTIIPPPPPPPPPPTTCYTATTTWRALPFPAQSGAFTTEFDATPAADSINGVIGLSRRTSAAYESLAVILRFAPRDPSGFQHIDARDAATYKPSSIVYRGGTTYHFRIVGDVSTHHYSAWVKVGAGAEILIANNYAFRTEQAAIPSLSQLIVYGKAGVFQLCGWTQQ